MMCKAPKPDFNFYFLGRLSQLYRGFENTNINVARFGEETVALSDVWKTYSFNSDTLETGDGYLPKAPGGIPGMDFNYPSISHPVPEFNTTNFITVVTPFSPYVYVRASIDVYRVRSVKEREIVKSIPIDIKRLSAMHSMAASANYALVFSHPFLVDVGEIVGHGAIFPGLKWNHSIPTDLYVVSLRNGDLIKLGVTPYYHAHHVNSYEEDDLIVVDYVTYSLAGDGSVQLFDLLSIDSLHNRKLRNSIPLATQLRRFIVNLTSDTVNDFIHPETTGAEVVNQMDMPTINEKYRHSRVCFVYGIVYRADGEHLDNMALVKKNLCEAGQDKVWQAKDQYVSEPRFVARPGATEEDDGVLLCNVMDGGTETSYMAIFDPVSMTLLDRADTPIVVPFTAHGEFFPFK